MKEITRTAARHPVRPCQRAGTGNQGPVAEAQQEDWEEYARSQGWVIVGVYIDAAKTARKRLGKRTNFLRMLEDVKQDKVDLILFTRPDRWFRSVADYYKVMEILEAHNCGWMTTQEQYDTTTAGGILTSHLSRAERGRFLRRENRRRL